MHAQWLARATLGKWRYSIGVSQSMQRFRGRYTPSRSYSSHNFKDATILARDNPVLNISREVKEAIENNVPVVALESAIYTHGFPYPENTALASHLELKVRANGAVPATVGVFNGVARVGLSTEELLELTASAGKPNTRKVSRRDLAYVGGMGLRGNRMHGGTTISGTMVLAALAGIEIFATGGLGGVHRDVESTMDVSADLTELGRTPMAVVSSGCKGFLDIPRTLEYLETQGVGVMSFADGREGDVDFPAFWSRDGVPSPFTIRNEADAAAVILAQRKMHMDSGLLFANPIPAEHSIPKAKMDAVILQALQDAEAAGSKGSRNTPFVLQRIRELTQGRSVAANRALIESNVLRGTRIAVELSKLRANNDSVSSISPYQMGSSFMPPTGPASDSQDVAFARSSQQAQRKVEDTMVVVAGSLAIDLSCDLRISRSDPSTTSQLFGTSNPAVIRQGVGGVGRNLAMALHLLGVPTRLCSRVGKDIAGSVALDMVQKEGLDASAIRVSDNEAQTAKYIAVNDENKDLVMAVADMDILEEEPSTEVANLDHVDTLKQWADCRPQWLVVDANWSPQTLRTWLKAGRALGARVALEPVSVAKSKRLFANISRLQQHDLHCFPDNALDIASPNALELAAMHEAAAAAGCFEREEWFQVINSFALPSTGARQRFEHLTSKDLVDQGIPQQSVQLLPFIPCIVTTLGEKGVLLTQLLQATDDRLKSQTAAPYLLSRSLDESGSTGGIYMRLFPPSEKVPKESVINTNGAGDTWLGILIAALAVSPDANVENVIDLAQKGSVMTLKSTQAVSEQIRDLRTAIWRDQHIFHQG